MKPKTATRIGAVAVFMLSILGCAPSPRWGYLANSGSPVPIKGVYFFTGDAWPGQPSYTFTPKDAPTHLHWTSCADRPSCTDKPNCAHFPDCADNAKHVLDMMASAGINVIIMSYWGSDIGSAPMQSTEEAGDLLFDAAVDHHIPILPAVEVASGLPNHYAQDDFVQKRLLHLIDRYLMHPAKSGWPAQWARVYDQSGQARYAVQLIGVASNGDIDAKAFVGWLDTLAESVSDKLPAPIGFVIEPGIGKYTPNPALPGNSSPTRFQDARSFLAIQGFLSEIDNPKVPMCKETPWCDNNGLLPADYPHGASYPNREGIAAEKRKRLAEWIRAGLPVVIDVNPGFDGHYVWGGTVKTSSCAKQSDCTRGAFCNDDHMCQLRNGGIIVEHTEPCTQDSDCGGHRCNAEDHLCHFENGYWGDNAFYYDDYFRNYMSQLRGMGNVGITYSSWNQYTEGPVGVPSLRVPAPGKPQDTGDWDSVQFNWLKDMYAVDPRQCNHVHYVDGGRTKFYVYGAICEHWQALSYDGWPPSVTVGEPTSSEMDTPGKHGRMNRFSKDQHKSAIYWSGATNAHEVHGAIYDKYFSLKEDSSYLGLPTTDELPSTAWCHNGTYNAFERGWIDFCPDDGTVWAHSNPTQGFPGRDK
jgi:hypothetical protein